MAKKSKKALEKKSGGEKGKAVDPSKDGQLSYKVGHTKVPKHTKNLNKLTNSALSSRKRSRKEKGKRVNSGDDDQLPKTEEHKVDVNGTIAGYNGNQVTRLLKQTQVQPITASDHMQFQETSFIPQNQFIGPSDTTQITRNDSTGLALGPPHQQTLEFQPMGQLVQSSNHSYDNWSRQRENSQGVDDFFSEEEIRMRSHQILENEDMQHLLRVFSMGGASAHEDGFGFPSYIPSPCPNFNFDEERSRPSGKAVVGWLKIKAAMRWGIFIRKKAAERRAQLIELED